MGQQQSCCRCFLVSSVQRSTDQTKLLKMRNGNQGAVEMSHIEKFWRDATAADVARVMAGEKLRARFRDYESKPWDEGEHLGGWLEGRWKKAGLGSWSYCQVYSPPQWFVDKPETGEGYKLLEKFPDEALQPGDEFFENNQWWPVFLEDPYPQVEGIWYRRRIEQPEPEPKHYVLQVGDTAETPAGYLITITDRGYSAKAP